MGEFSGFALVPEQGAIPQKHQLDPDMQRRIEAMAVRVDIRDLSLIHISFADFHSDFPAQVRGTCQSADHPGSNLRSSQPRPPQRL